MRSGARAGSTTLHDRLTRGRVMSQPIARFGVISGMIETADNLAKDYDISREACDAYAARSHQRATAAWAEGKFDDELVPVAVPQKRGDPVVFAQDEGIRADATPGIARRAARRSKRAASSPPATPASRTTPPPPASSSPRTSWTSWGSSRSPGFTAGRRRAASRRAWASARCRRSSGCSRATALAGSDIDLVELNEAFAPQVLAVLKGWGWR